MRKIISLNNTWNFYNGDIKVERPLKASAVYMQCKNDRKHIGPAAYYYFDRPDCYYAEKEMHNEGWQTVTVPHDFIIDQDNDPDTTTSHGYVKYNNAWYRKTIELDEEECRDKRILLQFDGIATRSEIYLNGSLMKRNFSAYNSFEIDITNNVYYDKPNVIAVYVNTEEFEGWWYQGGGIYREARILIIDKTAIYRYGVYAPYRKIDNENWEISFETTVINTDFADVQVKAVSELIDKKGRCAAKAEADGIAAAKDKIQLCSSAAVNNPDLWNVDTPNLYTIKTTLYKNGEEVDEYTVKTGFRTIELSPEKGLLINGEKTVIKGVNCHQDFCFTGIVMPRNIAYYRAGLLKEMGANGYRASHYQQTSHILDAADELGLLVMDETRWFETTDEAYSYLEELVKRDRNRPSVIFWSTGNEERVHITDIGKKVHRDMAAFIRKLDKTRPITTCEDKDVLNSAVFDDCDVIAINYNLANYDEVHKKYPDKLIVAAECCATGTTRDWHLPANNNGKIKDRDRDTNAWFPAREKTWKFLTERPYVIGAYQWAGIEHRGEAAWPRVCSVSGALDLFLQRKGAFYQNMSHWSSDPMIHIVQHWNFAGFEGKPIAVDVYTNCDELELFLNGESLGRRTVEKYTRSEWSINYVKGTLAAVGYTDGKKVCEDIKRTSGKAAALKLTLENEFEPNGSDLAFFTCECVDENGLTVPDAGEYVTFNSNEDCVIVGTGSDNCDHIHVSSNERKMYAGKISVALKPKCGAETVELYAQSENCIPAVWVKKYK